MGATLFGLDDKMISRLCAVPRAHPSSSSSSGCSQCLATKSACHRNYRSAIIISSSASYHMSSVTTTSTTSVAASATASVHTATRTITITAVTACNMLVALCRINSHWRNLGGGYSAEYNADDDGDDAGCWATYGAVSPPGVTHIKNEPNQISGANRRMIFLCAPIF